MDGLADGKVSFKRSSKGVGSEGGWRRRTNTKDIIPVETLTARSNWDRVREAEASRSASYIRLVTA